MSNADDSIVPTSFGMGITKRELFAAMAMQGLLTDRDATPSGSAAYAVKCADALLRAIAEGDGAANKSGGSPP